MLLKILIIAGLSMAPCLAQIQNANLTLANSGGALGVGLQQIDEGRAVELGLPQPVGLEITHVLVNSPAALAGLRVGDVISAYDGELVVSMEQFARLVRETPAGTDVGIDIYRDGAMLSVTAKVTSRRALAGGGAIVTPRPESIPDVPHSLMTWRSPVLGVEAESLDGQLAGFFGVGEGVLVRSVANGSAAEAAGIMAGDVIVSVDGSGVKTPSDITARLRAATSDTVTLTLYRNRKKIDVPVKFDGHAERVNPGPLACLFLGCDG